MTRKALIIANPGEAGASNYCEGVARDVENYSSFLKSPIGGLWYDSEISILDRPTAMRLQTTLSVIGNVDYLFLVFSGHGWYSEKTKSTIVSLRNGEDFDSSELKLPSIRQTIVLDCCRESYDERPVAKSLIEKAARRMPQLHPERCRKAFDKGIVECPKELLVLYGCSIGERSGDDSQQGGAYSSSLIDSVQSWYEQKDIDTDKYYASLDIPDAHQAAVGLVTKKRGGRQNPMISKPRSGPYFPIGIIA
ncbi:caspase family protein [Geothrix fuzhouensis]|uniref:caspase family protein n=1 Tax=Geothrix fuzhouensis TaxID=2966451 RepID=UPI0021498F3B|nr:caspase family protein [Geothrix fuzhouensis]